MKILFVGIYPNAVNPYANVFFRNLIYKIADLNNECTVISPISITNYKTKCFKIPNKVYEKTPQGNTITVYYPKFISFSSKKFFNFNTGILSEKMFENASLRVSKKIKDRYDCVYGHFILYGGLAAIKIAKKRKCKSFIAYGECDYNSEVLNHYKEISNDELSGLTGIISVSTNNANVLMKHRVFSNFPLLIAPNAVDHSLFMVLDKIQCREKLGLPLNDFIVGFVGGFENRKGDKRLLSAINLLNNDVKVAFAGKGKEAPSGEKVVFCKSLLHNQIPIFLNAIDVFCLPTLNEGSCNAIIEAASCRKAIISSDLPFNNDFLNLENSILIDPNSEKEISTAINELYINKKLRKKISEQAYEDSKQYTLEARAIKILNFIKSFVSTEDEMQ